MNISYNYPSSNRFKNIVGKTFGILLVVKYANLKYNRAYWECLCQCGITKIVSSEYLHQAKNPSCGCVSGRARVAASITHGLSGHPINKLYRSIKARCYNKNVERYKNYGGRGIRMCDEWLNDFKSFYDWCINNGWKKELSIDRFPNNDGNYEPTNCRFATMLEQSRRKTTTKLNAWQIRVGRQLRSAHKWKIRAIAKFLNVREGTLGMAISGATWKITDEEKEQERQRILSESEPKVFA